MSTKCQGFLSTVYILLPRQVRSFVTISYKILRDLILFSLVQQNFDVAWCRGAVKEKILLPWLESMRLNGLKFWENKRVTDFIINEDTGCISGLVCGQELYKADAFVLAVGISTVQSTILSRYGRYYHVKVPNAVNICFGSDDSISWTFCDLNSIYDEYQDEPATVLEAEIKFYLCLFCSLQYYANQLLPLKDEQIVKKVVAYLSGCVEEFKEAIVMQQNVVRHAKSVTHFFPGNVVIPKFWNVCNASCLCYTLEG
ncbi:hypothetical protein BHM03_00042844 [Ensete ventricosum]|nr:hypothetical protein BHM03_00042844 [Ensete ventricosum]